MNKYLKTALLTICMMMLVVGGIYAVKNKAGDGGWLGVYMQSVDYDLAEVFDLPVSYGVIINRVMDDSPADQAGLKEEDIIVGLDGHKITGSDDLVELLRDLSSGEEISLTILRDGDEKKIKVELTENPDPDFMFFDSPRSPKALRALRGLKVPKPPRAPRSYQYFNDFSFDLSSSSYIGVSLSSLSDQLGDYFGVKDGEGALVTEVEEDSPAEKAGIKAGDVIVGVDGSDVDGYGDIQKAIRKKSPGDEVTVNIIRNRKKTDLMVEVGERDQHGYNYFFGDGSDLDIAIPDVSHFFDAHFDKAEYSFEVEKYKKEMEELKFNMKKLKQELGEIKKMLD